MIIYSHACRKNSCYIKEHLESRSIQRCKLSYLALEHYPLITRQRLWQEITVSLYSSMIIETVHAWLIIMQVLILILFFCIPDFDLQLEDNTAVDGVIQQYSCGSGVVWKAQPSVIPSNGGSSKPHVRLQEYCWAKNGLSRAVKFLSIKCSGIKENTFQHLCVFSYVHVYSFCAVVQICSMALHQSFE